MSIETRDEEALIGAILVKPGVIFEARERVESKDFADDALGLLFSSIEALLQAGVPLDANNIVIELKRSGVLDRVGVARYGSLVQSGLPHHARFYSEKVARHSQVRRLKAVVASVAGELEEPNAEPQAIAERAQSAILEASGARLEDIQNAGEICIEELERLEMLRTTGACGVLATGFCRVDKALSGGLPTGISILAARTSIGKSALAMQIGCSIAKRGEPVVFVSLEMSESQNADRLLSLFSGIDIARIHSANYSEEEATRLLKAAADIKKLPLHVWQAAGANAQRIESMLRTAKARFGCKLAIVDYLGLIGGDTRASVYERVTNNSQALAMAAKRLDLPILLLAQLNRCAEGEVPQLHHLRDSGSIEQDAEVIALIHRERENSVEASFLVEKNRQAGRKAAELRFENGWFIDPTTAFSNDFGGAA